MSNFVLLNTVSRQVAHVESDDPYAALHLCRLLKDFAEDHIDMLVKVLRERGGSWSDIGDALGVTRQAAHQRFAHQES